MRAKDRARAEVHAVLPGGARGDQFAPVLAQRQRLPVPKDSRP